jgi:hypothetical protein
MIGAAGVAGGGREGVASAVVGSGDAVPATVAVAEGGGGVSVNGGIAGVGMGVPRLIGVSVGWRGTVVGVGAGTVTGGVQAESIIRQNRAKHRRITLRLSLNLRNAQGLYGVSCSTLKVVGGLWERLSVCEHAAAPAAPRPASWTTKSTHTQREIRKRAWNDGRAGSASDPPEVFRQRRRFLRFGPRNIDWFIVLLAIPQDYRSKSLYNFARPVNGQQHLACTQAHPTLPTGCRAA